MIVESRKVIVLLENLFKTKNDLISNSTFLGVKEHIATFT